MIRQPDNSAESIGLNKSIANYLLTLKIGDQLLSTRELADQFNASLGSISYAVNNLEEIGAVTINRRGRLGSFLEKKSLGALWNIIENSPMIIALTLPSFPKCEGLATALYSLLNNAGIETYMIFLRGSFNRMKALRDGRCHAVVISELAADEFCGQDEEVILRLPPRSFVTDHRVFYRSNIEENSQPLRVGIDYDSFDLKYITELEFSGCDVVYYPVPLTIIDRHLEKSTVDAAISNLDHLERLVSNEIASRPLKPNIQALIGQRDTSAAIVIRAGSDSTKIVLDEILEVPLILEIQQQVVDGTMVPRY